jgi:hypothetical protein
VKERHKQGPAPEELEAEIAAAIQDPDDASTPPRDADDEDDSGERD